MTGQKKALLTPTNSDEPAREAGFVFSDVHVSIFPPILATTSRPQLKIVPQRAQVTEPNLTINSEFRAISQPTTKRGSVQNSGSDLPS